MLFVAQVLQLSPLDRRERSPAEQHDHRGSKRRMAANGRAGGTRLDGSPAGAQPAEHLSSPVGDPAVVGAAARSRGLPSGRDSGSETELDSEAEEARVAAELAEAEAAMEEKAAAEEADRQSKQRKQQEAAGSRETRRLVTAWPGDKCAPRRPCASALPPRSCLKF